MRHALFCKIAVRLALFIFIDYYLLSPFPGWLIDYEYIKSIAIADYFDQLMKPDYGEPPWPGLQDDIFAVLLSVTGLISTLLIMVIIEAIVKAVQRSIKRKKLN
ncbi:MULTISPECIES: hypothetical protein [Rahnella]|jgi:hypothetical protein|uniref:hypothetical protein n=1 Tax=Rahnella TaxID=34037 RepID=UPI000DD3009F|nr:MULTISPECIES: hypothetical protein [Rahnella]RYJ12584.1 hypothetical protein C5Y41_24270 [Rahnella variigena]TCQ91511.1 hypothetical protein EC840_10269 [Rahnella sp. JUb53]